MKKLASLGALILLLGFASGCSGNNGGSRSWCLVFAATGNLIDPMKH